MDQKSDLDMTSPERSGAPSDSITSNTVPRAARQLTPDRRCIVCNRLIQCRKTNGEPYLRDYYARLLFDTKRCKAMDLKKKDAAKAAVDEFKNLRTPAATPVYHQGLRWENSVALLLNEVPLELARLQMMNKIDHMTKGKSDVA